MVTQRHLLRKEKVVDPYLVLSGINAVLSVVSNGLSVAAQVLSLVLPFL